MIALGFDGERRYRLNQTMQEIGQTQTTQAAKCSNCSTTLTGQFCSHCGQSRKSLSQPAFELLKDVVDSSLSWDGRLLTTFRDLYILPGEVARKYIDGRRAQFAPPFRLYVVVSILFFIIIPLSGVKIIGIVPADATLSSVQDSNDIDADSDDLMDVRIVLFRPPWVDRPSPLSPEQIRRFEDQGVSNSLEYRMLLQPEEAETRLNAAAARAMLSMVIVFALINALLHPKKRLINHVVYSLYFHAAMMPLLATGAILGAWMQSVSSALGMILTIIIATVILFLAWSGERKFYDASLIGASIRIFAGVIFYFAAMLGILICIALLTIT